MAYVVVVFAMINTAALVAVAWYARELWRELPGYVQTAIVDEVRKQDDRIEKRLAKAIQPSGNDEGPIPTATDGMKAGQPYRRR